MFQRNSHFHAGHGLVIVLMLACGLVAMAGCSNSVATPSGPKLSLPASDELWSQSANATAQQVRKLIQDQRIDDAVKLTRRALDLPRHPDRNDSFGWGHATLTSMLLFDALVDAERWDDVIELGYDPDFKIGNELIESQRIRALSLAHWSKHQFAFRARLFDDQLEELRKSLVNRFDALHHGNQICPPEELIEIDDQFLAGMKQDIQSSHEFISILENSKPKSKPLGELKTLFRDSKVQPPLDREPGESDSAQNDSENNAEPVMEFESSLTLHRPAPPFEVTATDGEPVSFGGEASSARLLVFYLGGECLHCARQLKAIAPHQSGFEQAGIEVVGISADGVEALAKSLKVYNGAIQFPILADGDRKVFQQFRLAQDSQEEPLHGTFLIDRFGKVLWYDFGEEPFTDISFLLNESKRLIAKSEQ